LRKILDKTGMTEQDWQNYRGGQKGIGGSEVATILGLNPYKSKFVLWLEKTEQVARAEVNNQFVEWGNILEPVIRDKFSRTTGFEVWENPWVMCHDEHDFMVANIDGEVLDPNLEGKGILEIKTTREFNKKDWEFGVPVHYLAQVQHYLAVMGTDYKYAYVAVLIGGNDYKHYLVERDDYIIDKIIRAEMEFMRMVEERISPEIGGSKSESDWLLSQYPLALDIEGELSSGLELLALEYKTLAEEEKRIKAELDKIKNTIRLEAQDFKYLKSNKVKITMPTIRKVLFDSKRFAEEKPDLYDEYKTKESIYRGFDVSFID
jgi:putative phage-type endonuclease